VVKEDFRATEASVALLEHVYAALLQHLDKGLDQEDLTFAAWRPSQGFRRYTAVLNRLLLPHKGDRLLHGNVAFMTEYLQRSLGQLEMGEGLALIHGHPVPGWQGMSRDDVVAERDRLAGPAFGRTGLPLLGLTAGTDGSLSARMWNRKGPHEFERQWASNVRVVGRHLGLTFHPELRARPIATASQVATVSVWGDRHQADLSRCRVGIVGLGSVGSLVTECLARMGITDLVFIDPDRIEERNLDRTAGATAEDASVGRFKVSVAERHARNVSTSASLTLKAVPISVLTSAGLNQALDCDVLFSCVDRPAPRHLLNALAYAHLIPVIDGGILARVEADDFIHADWRIHTVGPGRPCLVCLGALDTGDVALDIAGKLDDPDYIKNLPEERRHAVSKRNVFPFSMSVAAHEILQFVGCVTGMERIGGVGAQTYHCYPGEMEVDREKSCAAGCAYMSLAGSAADLSGNLNPQPQ